MTVQPPAAELVHTSPPAAVAGARSATNGVGIAALVLGIGSLVLAAIPLTGGFGGFLAFVGLALGVIGVCLKGRRRRLAIAGTVASGLALILFFTMGIVYAAAVVASVDASVSRPSLLAPGAGEQFGSADLADVGTLANPAPLGATVTIAGGDGIDWEITPLSAVLDATADVEAANRFNPDPEPGTVYAKLDVHVKYVGPDSGDPSELVFTYVSAAGREYDAAFVVMAGQLSGVSAVFSPGETTGSVIIEIPAEAADQGAWGVAYMFGDPFYFEAA